MVIQFLKKLVNDRYAYSVAKVQHFPLQPKQNFPKNAVADTAY
jgi:hypothetical protein